MKHHEPNIHGVSWVPNFYLKRHGVEIPWENTMGKIHGVSWLPNFYLKRHGVEIPWENPMIDRIMLARSHGKPMAINTTGMMVLSNGVTHLIAMAQYRMLYHGVTQLFHMGSYHES
jgi:hypothetical protein